MYSLIAPMSTPQPVYFHGPHEVETGYLSPWDWSPFSADGTIYTTAQTYMLVQKARLFADADTAAEALSALGPRDHRVLEQNIKGFDAAVWDEHKSKIAIECNMLKFTISEDAETLRAALLATGEQELVEAAPDDRVWGIGFGKKDAEENRDRWGQNLWGKALMEVRRWLRGEGGGDG